MADAPYEVQILQGGRWIRSDTFQDSDSAVSLARRVAGERSVPGVKVVTQEFDGERGAFVQRTVFRWSETNEQKAKNAQVELKLKRQFDQRAQKKRELDLELRKRTQRRGFYRYAIGKLVLLAVLLAVGFVVLDFIKGLGGT
ncbi:MAG: hypothetical protein ACE5Q3_01595 [Alphaproteobacteria bacterium]